MISVPTMTDPELRPEFFDALQTASTVQGWAILLTTRPLTSRFAPFGADAGETATSMMGCAASLVNLDGVLHWQRGFVGSRPSMRRGYRRAGNRRRRATSSNTCDSKRSAPSRLTNFLEGLDDKLTPPDADGGRGLRKLSENGPELVPTATPPSEGKILLLVHGTFSNSAHLVEAIQGTPPGREFLRDARRAYPAGIFTFDHPTLAASPLENAIDLTGLFRNSNAVVDLIAHSRGGLVGRWWFEWLSTNPKLRGKAVFVGSPLAGTSLAAPPRWQSLMDYLTNLSNVIGYTAGAISFAVPCLTVASALLRILGSVTSFAAKTPLADAAVGLVPGLFGQSRVSNCRSLRCLRSATSVAHERYYAIQSNFEPEAVGWKFWKILNRPIERTLNVAADALFDGPNDLVVDVGSMSEITDKFRISPDHLYDFGTNSTVYHTNYFAQPKTYENLRKWLL